MAATSQEKFEAAVKVIQSLPKNVSLIKTLGSFQPSYELMLKFYGYYKQATEGPCRKAKPSFWDVIGKAKWDAWNKLGEMEREKAMVSYVEELKKVLDNNGARASLRDRAKIVETMPHTEMVADFVEKLGSFYEIVEEPPPVPVNGNIVSAMRKNSPSKKSDSGSESLGSADLSSDNQDSSSHLLRSDSSRLSSPEVRDLTQQMELMEERIAVEEHLQIHAGLKGHDEHLMPNGSTQLPTPNGHVWKMNGDREDSESETEEYCDTSDLFQQTGRLEDLTSYNRPVKAAGKGLNGNDDSDADSEDFRGNGLNGHGTRDLDSSPDHDSGVSDSVQPLSSANLPAVGGVMTRGGGDDNQSQSSIVPRTGSGGSLGSQPGARRMVAAGSRDAGRRSHFGAAGGGSGGQDPPHNPLPRFDVNEQIAVALVRLQQDMNSVLTRLNTLETLTVQQHQIQRSRQNSESNHNKGDPWWWPFQGVAGRTVFFFMIWPFIVHWFLRLLAKRRDKLRLKRK